MVRAVLSEAIKMHVCCWWVVAPLAITSSIIYLPFKLTGRLLFGKGKPEPKEAFEIELKIHECENPKDEILMIHGYPDCGKMWDAQVEALKSEYRCLVVTLPFFSNKYKMTTSWGVDIPDLVKGLAKIVETKSNKKKVTLL